MTQREIDIQEIECAISIAKDGHYAIWSAVRTAVDRLEADDNERMRGKRAVIASSVDGETEDWK